MEIKKKLYEILESTEKNNLSRIVNGFIFSLILINLILIILETEQKLFTRYASIFKFVDIFSVVIFTLEYLSRLFACTENPKYRRPVFGRIRFALSFYILIDLIAILPFYIPMLITFDLRFIRIIRFFRIFRILKLHRYSKAMKTLISIFRGKKEELGITFFAIMIILIISSSLLYFVEHPVQPEVFTSIPAAMWWGISALTTVGYGDIYPVTMFGKFLSSVIAILAIGFVAIPTGILASGFTEKINNRIKKIKCPHCGEQIDIEY
jgi:voltage-gated potassium channel